MRDSWAWVRYENRVVGWRTPRGRVFVIDALTDRAIRKGKRTP